MPQSPKSNNCGSLTIGFVLCTIHDINMIEQHAFRPHVKDLGNAHLNLKTVKEFATRAKTEGVGLIHVNTLITPDNGNRIISTEISGEGKTGTIVVFRKVHEIVKKTIPGATDKLLSEREIMKRKLTNKKYINRIRKDLPGKDIVGFPTNTLIKTKGEQIKKNAKFRKLSNSAKQKGIKPYRLT